MINGSRVIGPAIAGVLYPIFGAAWMFTANAVTYLFVILALLVVRFPAVPRSRRAGLAAPHGRLPGRPREPDRRAASSLTLPIFSFFCLPFVTPVPGARRAGPRAVVGQPRLRPALRRVRAGRLRRGAVDRHRAGRRRQDAAGARRPARLRRGDRRSRGSCGRRRPPIPVVFVLGAVYFGTTTAMLTVLQTVARPTRSGAGSWRCGSWPSAAWWRSPGSPSARSSTPPTAPSCSASAPSSPPLLAWWCDLAAAWPGERRHRAGR